jgi:predicted porin
MKRKLLPMLIAGATAVSANIAFAAAVPTVYGKVNVTLNQYNFDSINTTTKDSYTSLNDWKLESNASRLGVKGDLDIAMDLKAVYKLEYEIYPDADRQGDGTSPFKQRNTYAGLQGKWGTLFAGKNDTPLKAIAAETVQLFKDLPLGDFKYVMVGENRENNIIQYGTPNLSGFVFSAQVQPGEDSGSKGAAGTISTSHTNHGAMDKYSAAVTFKQDTLYLALADDHNVQNTNILRAVGQYGIGPVTLGALWQKADRNYSTSNTGAAVGIGAFSGLPGSIANEITEFGTIYKSQDAYAVSAAWKIDAWTIKGQYAQSTSTFDNSLNLSDTKAKNYVLGADYALNSNVKVFAYYAAIDTEGDSSKFDGTLNDKTFAVGWEFKF